MAASSWSRSQSAPGSRQCKNNVLVFGVCGVLLVNYESQIANIAQDSSTLSTSTKTASVTHWGKGLGLQGCGTSVGVRVSACTSDIRKRKGRKSLRKWFLARLHRPSPAVQDFFSSCCWRLYITFCGGPGTLNNFLNGFNKGTYIRTFVREF